VALRHGVEGWVRNRRDGSVEAVFAGSTDQVRAVIEGCRRGPPGARVDTLEETAAGEELLAQRAPGDLFSMLRTE
jgi:acylphosphatase